MASRERRERNREDLKRKILETAQQIIAQEGFAALSMRKLAERIEYSPASIYLHFRNREQIAQELSEFGFQQLLTMMNVAATKKDAVDRVKAVALAYVAFGLQNPETYRLIFMSDSEYMDAAFAKQDPEHAANRSYQLLINVAEKLKRDNRYRGKASATEIAEMVWAAMHGIMSLKLACGGFQISAEILAKVMIRSLLNGLVTPKTA